MAQARQIAAFLKAAGLAAGLAFLAMSLAGCGGYALLDPDATASFSAKTSDWNRTTPSGATPASDTTADNAAENGKTDAMALNSLFARAAAGKLNSPPDPPPSPAAPMQVADAAGATVPVDATAAVAPEKAPIEPRGRAYLFRGVAGLIYSRGMDRLAERIKRTGIEASVSTYLLWRDDAARAIRDYRRDPQPITIIGHSMGGDSAVAFAERLNAENIPVSLLVTYDPTRIADDVPLNVERYINIYQSSNILGGGNVVQGSHFHGHYASYNLKNHSELVHINIEKAERLQEQLVTKIAALGATPATGQGEAVPLHLEVPADAAIELWDSGLPVAAHGGDTLQGLAATYNVPFWALAQCNTVAQSAMLAEGQRVIVPRHLEPMAMPATVTSYAPTGR
jgi:pimeloyl-ACP methyl ester carboxylesterase